MLGKLNRGDRNGLSQKMLSAYTEATRNGDFNPKSAIISKNTNKKNIIF
jgi:hypothetical protein